MPPLGKKEQEYLNTGGVLTNGRIPTQIAPTSEETRAITSAELDSKNVAVTPPALPTDTTPYQGIISGAASYMTPTGETVQTPATAKTSDLTSRIETLMGSLSGKTAYSQEQMKAAGVPDIEARQRELAAQMTALTNEAQAIPLKTQQQFAGRGVTAAGLAPITTGALRENAIKALTINSEYALNAGQLETAKATAQRAVDLKYKDAEEEIERKAKLLDLYKPFMSEEQKRRAEIVAKQNEERKTELADKKKQQQDVVNIAQTNGDAATAAAALKLDPKSSTFTEDLASLQAGLAPKQDLQFISGTENQAAGYFDKATGRFTPLGGGVGGKGGGVSTEKSADLNAYASQYADTGKLPSPAELKLSGLSVGEVTSRAKELPKPKGALVSTNTGAKSSALSPTQEAAITAMNEIVNQTLPSLKDRFGKIATGLVGGTLGLVYTSQDRQDYNSFRQEFLSKLLVARSGAAVTEQEYERYSKLLPSNFNQLLFLGSDGMKKLNSLETSMRTNLDNTLNTQQLSIYGYSKVNVGGTERTVGEILDIGGSRYRVLPDGTLTDII